MSQFYKFTLKCLRKGLSAIILSVSVLYLFISGDGLGGVVVAIRLWPDLLPKDQKLVGLLLGKKMKCRDAKEKGEEKKNWTFIFMVLLDMPE